MKEPSAFALTAKPESSTATEVVFDWEPTIEAGAEQLAGHLHRRGEDSRLESTWTQTERV